MAALIGTIAAVSFSAIGGTYYNVARIGPYFTTTSAFDSATGGAAGGMVRTYLSGDTEYVGNVVYLSAANTVSHSATLANYNKVMGIVVGGTKTNMRASGDSASVGDTASFIGGRVIVLVKGRAWVYLDTGAGIAPGTEILASAKAGMGGRLTGRTTAIDSFYRIVGEVVDSGVSGTKQLANIHSR